MHTAIARPVGSHQKLEGSQLGSQPQFAWAPRLQLKRQVSYHPNPKARTSSVNEVQLTGLVLVRLSLALVFNKPFDVLLAAT